MALDDVLYSRECLGKDGKPVTVWKVRTMEPSSAAYTSLAATNGLDGFGKVIGDPRITPAGKILRRYGIDEIPQLYNIIRGEMSLVGLRPRTMEEWSHYPREHMEKALRYRPGWFSPAYSTSGIATHQDLIEREQEYLREKDVRPVLTDAKHFLGVIYCFLFKGVRSR